MLKNTTNSYGWPAIAMHWICALSVIGLFALGLYMVELDYYDTWYHQSTHWHESIGILFFVVLLMRIGWRLSNPAPQAIGDSPLQARLAHWAHMMLYVLMIAIPISGYLIATADGHDIAVFDWFEIPSLTGNVDNLEDVAGDIHYWLAVTIIVLTIGHLGAAIKHHFIDRDDTLRRMLRPGKTDTQ